MSGRPASSAVQTLGSGVQVPSQGRVFDLSSGWWPGMPGWDGHARLQVLTYRTPQGLQNEGDVPLLDSNSSNYGFISDMVITTTHVGTHIDAMAHVTSGPDNSWHGGYSANQHLGDFGPLNGDATELAPIVARGVFLDVPAALGKEFIAAHEPIGAADLELTSVRQGTSVRAGDVILIRTGLMSFWPDASAMELGEAAGVNLEAARWLSERHPAAVGSDTESFEVEPSGIEGSPEPVHGHLIRDCGIPIIEWVYLEELAAACIYEFLFVCAPLTIRGTTASPIRPLAIA